MREQSAYTCPVLGCVHPSREWAQREHGLCSAPDCDEPIQGWCATCGMKVCAPLHGDRRQAPDDGRFQCARCRWVGQVAT